MTERIDTNAALPPRALTIAGSDSGGGAGIEADLKTFTALGAYGMAAVTAVTAQNTVGVTAIHDIPPEIVAQQIDVVASDIGVDAAKTGMLGNGDVIRAVAEAVTRNGIVKLVVDPVMVAKSGDVLLQADAQEVMKDGLIPLAHVVTPNVPEAEALTGKAIDGPEGLRQVAERLFEYGPDYVLIKGGHLEGEDAVDYLYDGTRLETFSAPRIRTKNTHGTGCTYSAAIAAYLAMGFELPEAVKKAKHYLTMAIKTSFALGGGHGPLNHFWPLD